MNGDDGLLDEYTINIWDMTNPFDRLLFLSTENLDSALSNAINAETYLDKVAHSGGDIIGKMPAVRGNESMDRRTRRWEIYEKIARKARI
jgi:hypothetical protein